MVRRNNETKSSTQPEPVNQNSPQNIQQQLKKIRETKNSCQSYPIMKSLPKKIDEINPYILQKPSKFIEECLYHFGLHILQTCEDETNLEVAEQIIVSIIQKIIKICSIYPKSIRNLEFVGKLLHVKCHIFSYEPSKNQLFRNGQINSKQMTESFYLMCISATFQQLKDYRSKFLQQFAFIDVLELVDVINNIDGDPLNTRQADDLIQAICQHMIIHFSQRLQQKLVPKDWRTIRFLETKLLKKVVRFTIKNAILRLGVTLAKSMISHQDKDFMKQGLHLIQSYMIDYQKGTTIISEPEFISLIQDQQIYNQILHLPKFCGEALQTNKLFFQNFQKYNKEQSTRVKLLGDSLTLVHLFKQIGFNQFHKTELSKHWKDTQKWELFSYFYKIFNISSFPIQYFVILKNLSCENLTCQLFLQSVRIYIQDYHRCKLQYQKEVADFFEFCLINQKQYFQKDRGDSAEKLFREIIRNIFEGLNPETIPLMNQIISDEYLWHQIPNKQFCQTLASALQRQDCFLKITRIIKLNYKHRSAINFMIRRLLINGEGLQDRFTQLFTQGFKQLVQLHSLQEKYFNDVLALFKLKPQLDFQLFQLCFQSINQEYYSIQTIPSVLQYHKRQKLLLISPKALKFYQQTLTLMESTDSAQLQNKLCEFIVNLYYRLQHHNGCQPCLNLYYNFKQSKMLRIRQNGNQVFNSFLENNMADLISEAQNDQDFVRSNTLLGRLCLLQKGLEFTDLQGTTNYHPHQNYAHQGSEVKIKMINRVTIGEDVPKQATLQFQQNSTLNEILTAFGKLFKCGPEQIALIYNQQNNIFSGKDQSTFISPIYNMRSIINFSLKDSQTFMAQKSFVNPLKIPTLQQVEKSPGLKTNFMQAVTYVFNRFAVKGKMGVDQCLKFMNAATGRQNNSSDIKLKALLNFDSDKDGFLTLQDLVRRYKQKLQVAIFSKLELEQELANLRIQKDFSMINLSFSNNSQEPQTLRHKIMKDPHHLYQILFKYSKHPDQRIAKKSQQLLLYLPTLPKSLDKDYLDYSCNGDFEIYYKLIEVLKYLNRFAEDKQRCQHLMQIVTQQWVHGLLNKYRCSHNNYHIKSFKCLRAITKMLKYSQQKHQQHQKHQQNSQNPFLSTKLQNVRSIDLFLKKSLPPPSMATRCFTNTSPLQFYSRKIGNTKKIPRKNLFSQRIVATSRTNLFQKTINKPPITKNIFECSAKSTQRLLAFPKILTQPLANNPLDLLFKWISVKQDSQNKIETSELPSLNCQNSKENYQQLAGYKKVCESNIQIENQNILLKQDMTQMNNFIQQFQEEVQHEILPQFAKEKDHNMMLKLKKFAGQPQHSRQNLQRSKQTEQRHEQKGTRKDSCDSAQIETEQPLTRIRQ